MLARELRLRGFTQLEQAGLLLDDSALSKILRRAGLVVAVQLFQGPAPSIAFIGDQALQHGQRRWLLPFARVLDRTTKGCDMGEVGLLGEVTSDFRVGIGTGLLPTEQLHDQLVAEDNRGVALLRRPAPRHLAGGAL